MNAPVQVRRTLLLLLIPMVGWCVLPGPAAPFDLPRALLIGMSGTVLAVLGVADLPDAWRRSGGPVRFMLASALAMLSLLALSALMSEAPMMAILGPGSRFVGLATLAGAMLMFVAFPTTFRGTRDVDLVLGVLVATIVTIAGLGLLQVLLPGVYLWPGVSTGRATSTLGNPQFFGALLAVGLPLLLGLWQSARLPRWSMLLLGLILVAGLIASDGKLAPLAAGVGVAVYLGIVLRQSGAGDRVRGWFIATAPMAGVLGGIGAVLAGTAFGSSSAEARLLLWRAFWPTFMSQPFSGVGVGRLFDHYTEHRPPDTVYFAQGREALSDSSHTWLLDLAAMAGLLSVVLFCAVLITAGLALRRAWLVAAAGDRWRIAALAATLAAYGVQSSLTVPTPAIVWVGWLLLGLVASLGVQHGPARQPARALRVASLTAAGLVAVVLAVPVSQVLGASTELRRTAEHLSAEAPEEAWRAADRAAILTPWWPATHLALVEVAGSEGLRDVSRLMLLDAYQADPRSLSAVVMLAQLSDLAEDDAAAETWFQRAIELDPFGPRVRFEMASWGLRTGDLEVVEESLDAMSLVLDPSIPDWRELMRLRTALARQIAHADVDAVDESV